MTTPIRAITEMQAGQSQPEQIVNAAIRRLEQGANFFVVLDAVTAPPSSPADGDCYLIDATATGAFAGKEDQLAYYAGTGWLYITPRVGDRLWNAALDADYRYAEGTPDAWEPWDPGTGVYQPADATLTALSGQNWAANSLPIGSGADTVAQVTFAANTFPARSSSGNLVAKTISDFALTFLDDADGPAVRTTIGAVGLTGSETVAGDKTFSGNLVIGGDLTVNGTATYIDTDNVAVEDGLLKLARSNVANILDIGYFGQYQPSATPLFAGLFLDATDGKWKLFDSLQVEPSTTVDTGGTGYTASGLILGTLEVGTGSASAASIQGPSDPNTGIFFPAADTIAWTTGGTERQRLLSNGRMIQGHTASVSVGGNSGNLQLHGAAAVGLSSTRWSADANGPFYAFGKSRGAAIGTNGAVTANDLLGAFQFAGDDGTNLNTVAASIEARATGTISSGIVPGVLDMYTRTAAGALTRALRLGSDQSAEFATLLKMSSVGYTFATGGLQFGDLDTGFYESADDVLQMQVAGTNVARLNSTGLVGALQMIPVAISDETTALTTGTAKVTFIVPFAFTLTDIAASVTTAPTGADLIVDVNEGGTSIMTTNKLRIDAGEKSTATAATPPTLTDTSLAAGAEITIDIDQIGSTIAGAGLKVYLIGRPS